MKKILFLFFVAGITVANKAKAQSAAKDTATLHFITQASIGGLQEISAGRVASKKAVAPDVKNFGARMVADHSKAQAKLMQLAKAGGYNLPPAATANPAPDLMLTKATGMDFDRLYVHMMVPDHRKTVLLFQTYAITGKDPAIKAFAQQTLPVLKEHLAIVTGIDNKMKNMSAK